MYDYTKLKILISNCIKIWIFLKKINELIINFIIHRYKSNNNENYANYANYANFEIFKINKFKKLFSKKIYNWNTQVK